MTPKPLRSIQATAAHMHRVFVFGTLKRGFPLHDEGLGGATYLGAYRTAQRFPMFVAGPWFAPMMLDRPGSARHVTGELYEVDDSRLAVLDALESTGQPGNLRIVVRLERIEGGSDRAVDACEAFAYVKSAELAVPAHTDCLGDYQDRRFIHPKRRRQIKAASP
jgi:gamma-glutamylaminecyclotransferase